MVPVSAVRGRGSTAAGAASAGWWDITGQTCVAAYQPKGAASAAAALINLANPGTYDAANGSAYPTWAAATGWTGTAASSQYLTTGIDLTSGGAFSVIVQFSAFSGTGNLFGLYGAATTKRIQIAPIGAAGQTGLYNGALTLFAGDTTSGNLCIAGATGYKNGAALGALNAGAAHTDDVYIFALNELGTAKHFGSGTIAAVAIYSTTLSASDVTALTDRMNAL